MIKKLDILHHLYDFRVNKFYNFHDFKLTTLTIMTF